MTWDEERSKRTARRLQVRACWRCGYDPDAVSPAWDQDAEPNPGALLVCIACGAMSLVDGTEALGLYLRHLTPEEHQRAMADPRVVHLLEARAVVAHRNRDQWPWILDREEP